MHQEIEVYKNSHKIDQSKKYYEMKKLDTIKKESDDFQKYIDIVKNKKRYFLYPIIILVPIIIISIFLEKPVYESMAILHFNSRSAKIIPMQELVNPSMTSVDYATEFALMKGRHIIEEVINKLDLEKVFKKEESFKSNIKTKVYEYLHNAYSYLNLMINKEDSISSADNDVRHIEESKILREEIAKYLNESIMVRPKEMTKLVEVKMEGENPELISNIINTLTDIYINQNLENQLQETRKSHEWLEKEVEKLEKDMHVAEKNVQDFRSKKKITSFDFTDRENSYIREINERNLLYLSAKNERISIESILDQVRKISLDDSIPDSISQVLEDKLIIELKNQYFSLKSQISDLRKSYTENHPKVIKIRSQIDLIKREIDEEINKIVKNIEIKYRNAISKEASLRDQSRQYRSEIIDLDQDMLEYESLKREAEITRELYLSMSKRMREAALAEALEISNVRVVQRASPPLFPKPSGKMMKIFIGFVMSFGIGIIYILGSEYFDRRFKKIEEIESYLNIPVMGTVPEFSKEHTQLIMPISYELPESKYAESYRILRTRILKNHSESLKSLMITSALTGEGKSTISSNLGVSFAQLGFKILLVDVDLRKPALHKHLSIPQEPGLLNILLNDVEWESMIHDTYLPNLKAIPAGGIPSNPSELLGNQRMKRFLKEASEIFDFIILDAPVILSISDVEILSSEIDGILLIHNANKSDKRTTMEAKKVLERSMSNIIGVVINNINQNNDIYGYSQHEMYYGRNILDKSEGRNF